jgi:hypothetical protein
MGKQVHKDVEFAVDNNWKQVFRSFEDAVVAAVAISLGSEEGVNLDVLCGTKAGFRAAVNAGLVTDDSYDPDASVTQRFVIKATDQGKIP